MNTLQNNFGTKDVLMQEIPGGEMIIVNGDSNGHEGKHRNAYERVHVGYEFGDLNEAEMSILDFAVAFDLIVANTFFKKKRGTINNLEEWI